MTSASIEDSRLQYSISELTRFKESIFSFQATLNERHPGFFATKGPRRRSLPDNAKKPE